MKDVKRNLSKRHFLIILARNCNDMPAGTEGIFHFRSEGIYLFYILSIIATILIDGFRSYTWMYYVFFMYL